MASEAEATPSKLQQNPHLATGQLATVEVSKAVSAVASEDEAVASEEASAGIEVGLVEVSGAIEVGMEEEVGLATKVAVATKIAVALVADRLSEHLADLAVDAAAMTTREMAMAVVGMVEAVIVAQLVATETLSAVEVAVEIDTTTEIGMEVDDGTTIMALESDTTMGTLTTTQDQNADIEAITDKLWIMARQSFHLLY